MRPDGQLGWRIWVALHAARKLEMRNVSAIGYHFFYDLRIRREIYFGRAATIRPGEVVAQVIEWRWFSRFI